MSSGTEIFNDYLQSGVEVRYFDGKEERNEIVRLLDFNHPENNVFQVVNQWTFVEYSEKRPDIIIFINGMPLVISNLSRRHVWKLMRLTLICSFVST